MTVGAFLLQEVSVGTSGEADVKNTPGGNQGPVSALDPIKWHSFLWSGTLPRSGQEGDVCSNTLNCAI